jgi:hypothetical protein
MKKLLVVSIFLNAYFSLYSQDTISKPHFIGEEFGGGIVFYVDNSGQHGLIANKRDLTLEKVMWGTNGITNATSTTDGLENTKLIVNYSIRENVNPTKFAACGCDSATSAGYSDWYLPAIDELHMMYNNQTIIGNFRIGDYCSSTEYGKYNVCNIHFRPHKSIQFFYNKVDKDYYVRCIRKF